ncbi:gluconokinase [Rhizobium sp. RAF56]|uniref:gluconokinase n=1 Tax=Rhizobium sp. RAF56 TaxID=3233062 RepID=UPI003F944CDE
MQVARPAPPPVIVVMGVSGCGKSWVGEQLAKQLGVRFIEGDQLHPAENIAKMAQGIALTDADRAPWLKRIATEIGQALEDSEGAVFSCSCLKKSYRETLRAASGNRLAFVFLEGSRDVLLARMTTRQGHFMPASLLDNQLQVLEVPTGETGVVTVSIDNPLDTIVFNARNGLDTLETQGAEHGE